VTGVMAKPKRKSVADARSRAIECPCRTGLQDFSESLVGMGKASLEAGLDLPEREALQRAVQKLGPYAESLIGIIERSGISEGIQKAILLDVWGALTSAYTIGSQGTISENTKKGIDNLHAAGMRGGKDRRRREDPENLIIQEEVDRVVGSDAPPHKVVAIATNAALNRLPARDGKGRQRGRDDSGKLTDEAVRGRVIRRLEKVRS
jgi:hypothetical protein